jgi:hypothetical protein
VQRRLPRTVDRLQRRIPRRRPHVPRGLLARALPLTLPVKESNLFLCRALLESPPQAPPLRRGGKIDCIVEDRATDTKLSARSFAGIYVLVLWHDWFDDRPVSGTVEEALPLIEALVIALPPPDGPDATSGAAKMRA